MKVRLYFLLLLLPLTLYSQTTPLLSFNPIIASGLAAPLDIVNASDESNRLFIVQKGGTIRYARGGILIDTVFLNITSRITTASERGLLSMAFHPNYGLNGYFFVYFTDLNGDLTLARFQVSADPNTADSASEQVLLKIPHRTESNHNGGKLNFGADGYLYLATGDGGGGGDPNFIAQKGDTLLGKMLRINVDNFAGPAPFYTIPPDNPYAATNDNIKDEIWAFGLRNPFRWSFDRVTNDMWIGDVGQSQREEVNFRAAGNTGGINYGWRCYEGNLLHRDSGCAAPATYVFPVFDYGRSNVNGGQSITGGMVYRGGAYPALTGWYICIDFYSTNGWLIRPNGNNWAVQQQSGLPVNIAGFGEDENGELYAASLTSGIIYRVELSGVLPVKLQAFNAVIKNGAHEISWKITDEQNVNWYEVQYGRNGIDFQTIGKVVATNSSNKEYLFISNSSTDGVMYYRLKIISKDGQVEYSSIFKYELANKDAVLIAPTIVKDRKINIQLNKPFKTLQLFAMDGRLVKMRHLGSATGLIYLDVSDVPRGNYLIKFIGNGSKTVRKIAIQ